MPALHRSWQSGFGNLLIFFPSVLWFMIRYLISFSFFLFCRRSLIKVSGPPRAHHFPDIISVPVSRLELSSPCHSLSINCSINTSFSLSVSTSAILISFNYISQIPRHQLRISLSVTFSNTSLTQFPTSIYQPLIVNPFPNHRKIRFQSVLATIH